VDRLPRLLVGHHHPTGAAVGARAHERGRPVDLDRLAVGTIAHRDDPRQGSRTNIDRGRVRDHLKGRDARPVADDQPVGGPHELDDLVAGLVANRNAIKLQAHPFARRPDADAHHPVLPAASHDHVAAAAVRGDGGLRGGCLELDET
jgi:hypothetical protein